MSHFISIRYSQYSKFHQIAQNRAMNDENGLNQKTEQMNKIFWYIVIIDCQEEEKGQTFQVEQTSFN